MIEIKKLVKISHTSRNFKRYLEIVYIIMEYGFGGFLCKLPLRVAIRKIKKKFNKLYVYECISDIPLEVRFRMMLEKLGPTFIKFGQILSTRPDLIPIEIALELSKLQDKAPYFDTEEACAIIRNELNVKDLKEIFDEFDCKPFAAASIGQVYSALYKGKKVAVKVQRPNIDKIIETDLEIIMHISLMGEKYIKEVSAIKPSFIVSEFSKSLMKEIDFRDEARETKRFKQSIKDEKGIYCPGIIDELTTSRIMVSEFIEGIKPNDPHRFETGNYDRKLLSENLVESVLKQIFEYGYFHADPHPGNILIMPGNIVCFIDFGMVGRISPGQQDVFASLLMNVINKNSRKIAEIFLTLTLYDEEPDKDSFERDLYLVTDEYLLHDIKDVDFGKYFSAQMDIFARYKLRIRPEIFLLLKAFVSLEKTGKILAPDINMINKASPYVKKIYLERIEPRKLMLNMLDPVNETIMLINDLPGDLRGVLKRLKSGSFKVDLNYQNQNLLRESINLATKRIAYAVVFSSLIIGQGLILLKPPEALHSSITTVFGKYGFIATVIVGFFFLISNFRTKN